MSAPRNPNLDMTTQKGWILCSQDKNKRAIICNWCSRQHYYKMNRFWAPISIDLEDDDPLAPKCDMCDNALGEGPALFGDFTSEEETMGKEQAAPRGYVNETGSMAMCQDCVTDNDGYKKVVKSWETIMPSAKLAEPLNCMVCKKEL